MTRMPRHALSEGIRLRYLAGGACIGLLAGCASDVVVETSFPSPLVEPLPVSVGVYFDEALHNYVYSEKLPEQSTWTITLGDANVAMLSPLFDSMFSQTRELSSFPADPSQLAGLDAVLKPDLEKFEFDVPIGERDQFVEVWMQYRLKLYKPNGDLITEWPVSGYGKAELGHNREEAVNRAAIVAMREVGAAISTEFAQQPQVAYWLQETEDATPLSAETERVN